MFFRKLSLILFFTIPFILTELWGQCPSSQFLIEDETLCLNQQLEIENNSIDATSFLWDFCSGELHQTPSFSNIGTSLVSSDLRHAEIVESNGVFFGFLISKSGNAIVRLDFGAGIENSPTPQNLGNLGGLLNKPTPIKIVEENSNWYGLIHNGGDKKILLIDFGASLQNNNPTISVLASGVGEEFSNMDLIKNQQDWFLILSNYFSNNFTSIKLGTSIDNTPSPTEITNSSRVNGVGFTGLSLVNNCEHWYAVAVSFDNKSLYLVDYGFDLSSDPIVTNIGSGIFTGSPSRVSIKEELGEYVGYVTSFNNEIYKVNLGNDLSTPNPVVATVGSPSGQFSSVSLVNTEGNWHGFIGTLNGSLYRMDFPLDCGQNVEVSSQNSPKNISYNKPGVYSIRLETYNLNGMKNSLTKHVTVTENMAPVVSIVSSNQCIANSNTFTAIDNGDISSYSWDFDGDGIEDNTNNIANYRFITTGQHPVTLDVGAANGCSNSVDQTISIFPEPPTPDFVVANTTTCSNDLLAFTNLSNESSLARANISYEWDFDGESSSNDKNPSYTFSSAGNKQVSLTMSIPGCSSFFSKNINIAEGPTVDWSYINNCFGEAIQFNNLSFGDNITNYIWDFGDGTSITSVENPSHIYSNTGTFFPQLKVENSNECSTVSKKELNISDLPKVSFEFENNVENVPINFTSHDLTPNDDTIVSWLWDFSGLGSSTSENPSFTFTNTGEYEVSIQIETSQGCNDSFSTTVEIVESQFPTPSFSTYKNTACLDEKIIIKNTSANATGFLWDFCGDDLTTDPTFEVLFNIAGSSDTRDVELVNYNNNWFAFVTDRAQNTLKRLDFGDSPLNPPSLQNITLSGAQLNGATPIKIIHENNNWYGLIHNGNSKNILRVDFGSSILNTNPTSSEVIINIGNIASNLNFAYQNQELIVVLSNYVGSTFNIINFGNSVNNNPTTTDILSSPASAGAGFSDIVILNDNGSYFGFATAFDNNSLYSLKFGNELFSIPEINKIGDGIYSSKPLALDIALDNDLFHLLVSATSGQIYRTDLGSELENVSITNHTTPSTLTGNLYGLSLFKFQDKWLSMQTNIVGEISKSIFERNCGQSLSFTQQTSPPSVSFAIAGTHSITLYASHENGNQTSIAKTITISNQTAPEISFSVNDSQCLANTNTFTAIDNGGIDTYSWDFNADGIEDANEQNPNFQFESIGTQDVKLVVQASNGCFNNVSQEVVIYPEPPVPDFEITNTLICSNTELFFSNLSDESAHNNEVLSYTWDFDGEQTSAEKNTNYNFGTGGTKQVSLTMAIPGCESFISKIIEIASGPDVAFEFNDECEGAEVPFINQTTGEGITDYQWDFGDGFTSTSVHPSHAYDTAGDYDITLTSSNDMGCENSITQTITTHSIPVVSFINEVGCQNIPLQFTDQSLADNANITAWSWDFGGLGTSGEQNPQFTFSEAGEYSISLSAETNFGCLETISQTVSIAASPLVDFDVTLRCLNETTSFTDLTPTQENNPITSWFWEIDGQIFTTQNPEYAFESPGEYEISLTVTPENNCAIKLTKSILIESLPVVDFSVNRTCDNEFTIFSDLSTVGTTPITSRTWDLGGLATANGPSAAFNFPQAGTYDITLTILNEKGCTNQTTKTIEIFGSPKAALEADVNFGAPPLEVNFLNKSIGANFYSWDFDDPSNSVSTDKDPGFTFNEVNDYRVRLIAGNELGCSDTTYTTIVSSIPTLDLQLVKMEPSLNNGKINLTLTILNSGTIKIEGFDIVVGIENDFSISESFPGALNAAEQITYTLNFEIPATGSNINYLCIKLEDRLSSTTDNNPLNNEKCTNFGQLVIIENPFPNPAIDQVGFKLILPSTSNVDLSMMNIHGKTVYRQSFANLSSGLNTFSIDLQNFERGMYFLKISTHSKEEIKRIIKF